MRAGERHRDRARQSPASGLAARAIAGIHEAGKGRQATDRERQGVAIGVGGYDQYGKRLALVCRLRSGASCGRSADVDDDGADVLACAPGVECPHR